MRQGDRRTARRSGQPNELGDLLREWDRLYTRMHGIAYAFTRGKDAKLLQPGLRAFGFAVMADLMADFFTVEDPFIRNAGQTVPVFVSQLNKLAQRRRQDAGAHVVDWWEECQRLHGGTCGGRWAHDTRVKLDGFKGQGL